MDGSSTEQATVSIDTTTNDLLTASKANLRFYTGSTIGNNTTLPTNERMVITTAGKVGIGTTDPTHPFSVQNKFMVTSGGSVFIPAGQGIGIDPHAGGANTNIYFHAGQIQIAGTTDFKHNNANFIIENAGNVGIGTTSPGTALQVGGLDDGSNYDITLGWNAVDSQAVGTKRSAITFKTGQTSVNNQDIYKWDY